MVIIRTVCYDDLITQFEYQLIYLLPIFDLIIIYLLVDYCTRLKFAHEKLGGLLSIIIIM